MGCWFQSETRDKLKEAEKMKADAEHIRVNDYIRQMYYTDKT
jgi:hypothetical protein